MEHWEALCPGGYRFAYNDSLFRPGTDTFLLSSLPRLKARLRVMDLGCCFYSASRSFTLPALISRKPPSDWRKKWQQKTGWKSS